ncbi:hypothetical protein ASC87_27815 [Rhizobacter sp. Root1221]|nr:hypothetical protein ASC87_27815 [Rhizobacter sp. Root1221]
MMRAGETGGLRSGADIVEHVVLWGFASLVADGRTVHAALAREVLDELAEPSLESLAFAPMLSGEPH